MVDGEIDGPNTDVSRVIEGQGFERRYNSSQVQRERLACVKLAIDGGREFISQYTSGRRVLLPPLALKGSGRLALAPSPRIAFDEAK